MRVERSDEAIAQHTADELHEHEHGNRSRRDASEGVGQGPSHSDSRVGEAGGAGEPIGRSDVATDRESNGVGAPGPDGPEDDEQQPQGGDHLAQPQPAARADVCGDVHCVDVKHQVGDDGAECPPDELSEHEYGGVAGADRPECPLDERDDRVERRRYGLESQDERDQGAAGDQAVLQQLQPNVIR